MRAFYSRPRSREALVTFMRKQIEKKCQTCGKEFWARYSDVKIGLGRFCSRSCAGKSGAKKAQKITGPDHWLWKGGPEAMRERRIRDPIKENARSFVLTALRNGKLNRLPCQVCGLEKSEAHHKDYLKPLDVEWLCRKHHREADYRDKTKAGDFGH